MRRLQVFIASKLDEFRFLREGIQQALQDMHIDAVLCEQEGAAPESDLEKSVKIVAECDVLVAFFGRKYGEITAEEFRAARSRGKPVLAYVLDGKRSKNLDKFLKAEVTRPQEGVSVHRGSRLQELQQQVGQDIMRLLVHAYREGVRTVPIHALTDAARLAWDTADWYRALEGHTVAAEPGYIDHDTRDFRLRESGEVTQEILVACVSRYVQHAQASSFLERLRSSGAQSGRIVSSVGFSPAATKDLDEHRNVTALTFDELIDQTTNFDPYLDSIEADANQRRLDDYYLSLACDVEERGSVPGAPPESSAYDPGLGGIDRYFNIWLRDSRWEHLSVLGEFGSGKTWFLLRTAARMARAYREARKQREPRGRLPLLIRLRDFAKADPELLLDGFSRRRPEIGLRGYEAYRLLNRMGRLLLLFDGFDEMAQQVDRQTIVDNFCQLARLLVPGAKAVLTCRAEYFPDGKRTWNSLADEAMAAGKGSVEPPHFEQAYLLRFTESQLTDVLRRHGASTDTVRSILADRQLRETALRPQLVEFVMEALGEVQVGATVDLARIYLYAIRRKLQRENDEGRTSLSVADRLYFMCELSWEMLRDKRTRFSYREVPTRLDRLFGVNVIPSTEREHWQYAMQCNTLLVRNGEAEYSLAHRSLAEFFVAYKLVAELGWLAPDFLALAQTLEDEGDPKTEAEEQTWSDYFRRHRSPDQHRLLAFAAEPEEAVAVPGAIVDLDDLPPATLAFAADMVSTDETQLGRLCEIAWEETGTRSWKALSLLPYLKHRCSQDLAAILVGRATHAAAASDRTSTLPLPEGVAWVLGELGVADQAVLAALRRTVEAPRRGVDVAPEAWWQSAFALEKLGALGAQDRRQGVAALELLRDWLPQGRTVETAAVRLLANLGAQERSGALIDNFDVVALAACGAPRLLDEFLGHALPLVRWPTDRMGRRCYFVVWICGHLRRKESVEGVLKATRHPHSSVRNCACEALGKLGVCTPEVVAALEQGLEDTYYRARLHAAWSLGELGAINALPSLRSAARDERVADVRTQMRSVEKALLEMARAAGGPGSAPDTSPFAGT